MQLEESEGTAEMRRPQEALSGVGTGVWLLAGVLTGVGTHRWEATYSRTMPRGLWWSQGGGLFLVSVVPLQRKVQSPLGGDVREAVVCAHGLRSPATLRFPYT